MIKHMLTLNEVTTIRKYDGHLLVQGTDHAGKTISCIVYTEDVDNLWFSIQRARNQEKLRTRKEDRIERMKRGRLC